MAGGGSKPGTRPNIKEANKATRFKKGNSIAKDYNTQPYSIRRQFAILMDRDLPSDLKDLEAALKEYMEEGHPEGKTRGPKQIAARAYLRLALKMEPHLLGQFIESIEGKLPEHIIHGPPGAPPAADTPEAGEKIFKDFIGR